MAFVWRTGFPAQRGSADAYQLFFCAKSDFGRQPQAEQDRYDDGAGHVSYYAVPENTDRPWFCYQERSHHRKESRAFPEEPVLCFGQLHPLLVPLCVPIQGELELDNQQIVLDEMGKDFKQKFVAFAYESICRNIFAELCRKGQIDFAPSRIGSYWRNDNEGDTEIDVAAVDNQHKRLFLGECKYHAKPVDVAVYSALQEKGQSKELAAAFKGYEIVYGLFSKSGFTDRLVEMAAENSNLILIQEDAVYKK